MLLRAVPPGVLEILLFVVLLAAAIVAVFAIRRRWKVAPVETTAPLPDLTTEVRVMAAVRRTFRDPDQGVWLAEATVGVKKLTFCLTDYAANVEKYRAADAKTPLDFALYALGTLASGGVEAMRGQIVDYDQTVAATPDTVRLIPAGQFPNDYAAIGQVVSHREDTVDGGPVIVYRMQVERQADRTLFLDVAVEAGGEPPFAAGALVHGSARLFAYLG